MEKTVCPFRAGAADFAGYFSHWPRTVGSLFAQSARELKELRCITMTAALIACNVVLDLLNLRLVITQDIRVTFGFLAIALVGMLFGPVPAMMAGACTDLLGCVLAPMGPYFPGFTLTAVLGGMLYGMFLYKSPVRLWRVVAAKSLINLLLNIGLNGLWLKLLYGNAFLASLAARTVKNLLMLPIEVAMLYLVALAVREVYDRAFAGRGLSAPQQPRG